MEESDIKAATLSKAAGLNATYIRDLLRDPNPNPRVRHLQAVAEQLGCTLDYLINGTGDPKQVIDLTKYNLSLDDQMDVREYAKWKSSKS